MHHRPDRRKAGQGVFPWHKPWSTSHLEGRAVLPIRHNGTPYRGINILSLWMESMAKGYVSPRWMTFKQAIDLGGCVRKGEKGSLTVYADSIRRMEQDAATGAESETEIHYLKGYTVFNVEQIDGLPERYYEKPAPRSRPLPRIERAERFFAATGATVHHVGNQALYAMEADQPNSRSTV